MAAQMHLNTLMANMFRMGLLDNQFQHLHMFQDKSTPDFIAKVITVFGNESGQIIDDLRDMLHKSCVDFNKVSDLLYNLMGITASVGALRLKNICIQFLEFCQEKSKDGCLKTLNILINECIDLRIKSQIMVKLEQQAQTFDPKE
uniref:Uncharacterized protein n=1 Tax=Avena sativa TaxID=4498 RepID=A0ACD5YIL8_AVESA